jgi:hypothetical protein
MDDPVPAIDFSPTGNPDSQYSLEREDVQGMPCCISDSSKLMWRSYQAFYAYSMT